MLRTLFFVIALAFACVPGFTQALQTGFGPEPSVLDKTSKTPAHGDLTPSESSWIREFSADRYKRQCAISVDKIAAGYGMCQHRLSVLCMDDGREASIVGAASWTPIQLPVTLFLYQPPSLVPVGGITIHELGSGLANVITLNGHTSVWQRTVSQTGEDQCSGPIPIVKPLTPGGAYCARYGCDG